MQEVGRFSLSPPGGVEEVEEVGGTARGPGVAQVSLEGSLEGPGDGRSRFLTPLEASGGHLGAVSPAT